MIRVRSRSSRRTVPMKRSAWRRGWLPSATRRIAEQTRQRLAGPPRTAPPGGSAHDGDARPIAKGRLGRPVEFGYTAQVVARPAASWPSITRPVIGSSMATTRSTSPATATPTISTIVYVDDRARDRTVFRVTVVDDLAIELAARLGTFAAAHPVGADNPVRSCDPHVLVDEAAESVSSQRSNRGAGGWGSVACGRALMQRSVRTVRVVNSVRGAVPVFRPARFPGPLPEPAGRLSPQRALRKSQVGLAVDGLCGGRPGSRDGCAPVAVAAGADRGGVEQYPAVAGRP